MDTKLFVRRQPGGMFAIIDKMLTTGNIFWVNSATGVDGAGYGQNPDAPFATLDYAVGKCTANKGDIICLMPGHDETYSTTGTKVTMDVAGVRVIGLGQGADRPTFTFSHTGATWLVSANGCSVENCLFVTGVDSVTTYGTVSGADFTLKNCEGRDATDVEVVTDWTVTGDRLTVDGYYKNGYVGGDANARVFSLNGVDGAEIKNCRFITKVTTAVINFVSNACSGIDIHHNDFLVTSTTDLSKDVVDTVTGSTWAVWDCFDLGAGCGLSGGSGAALAKDDISVVSTAVSAAHAQITSSVASVTTNLQSSWVSWAARAETMFVHLMSEIAST